jgi:hypothetical protein
MTTSSKFRNMSIFFWTDYEKSSSMLILLTRPGLIFLINISTERYHDHSIQYLVNLILILSNHDTATI